MVANVAKCQLAASAPASSTPTKPPAPGVTAAATKRSAAVKSLFKTPESRRKVKKVLAELDQEKLSSMIQKMERFAQTLPEVAQQLRTMADSAQERAEKCFEYALFLQKMKETIASSD
jgi:hypothetical protein